MSAVPGRGMLAQLIGWSGGRMHQAADLIQAMTQVQRAHSVYQHRRTEVLHRVKERLQGAVHQSTSRGVTTVMNGLGVVLHVDVPPWANFRGMRDVLESAVAESYTSVHRMVKAHGRRTLWDVVGELQWEEEVEGIAPPPDDQPLHEPYPQPPSRMFQQWKESMVAENQQWMESSGAVASYPFVRRIRYMPPSWKENAAEHRLRKLWELGESEYERTITQHDSDQLVHERSSDIEYSWTEEHTQRRAMRAKMRERFLQQAAELYGEEDAMFIQFKEMVTRDAEAEARQTDEYEERKAPGDPLGEEPEQAEPSSETPPIS